MKLIFKLLILATICMFIWLGELFIVGWDGLKWLDYFHCAWLIIALILFQLVVREDGDNTSNRHLIGYPALIFAYMISISIILLILSDRHVSSNWNRIVTHSVVTAYSQLGIIVLGFGFITFLFNLIVARMEKVRLSIRQKIILFLSPCLIPLICSLVTVVLFSQSYIFSRYTIRPVIDGLQPIHWIKSGSYLFAFILYEGYFYLWLKGKFNFPL